MNRAHHESDYGRHKRRPDEAQEPTGSGQYKIIHNATW
jgi:hypothetical protein